MGAISERLRQSERITIELRDADQQLRVEVREGFAEVKRAHTEALRLVGDSVLRESAHTRGELARLDTLYQENRRADELAQAERKALLARDNEKLLGELKAQAISSEAAAKAAINRNRPYVALIVFLGLFAQWAFENWSIVRGFVSND
jgi:hypothetical protein